MKIESYYHFYPWNPTHELFLVINVKLSAYALFNPKPPNVYQITSFYKNVILAVYHLLYFKLFSFYYTNISFFHLNIQQQNQPLFSFVPIFFFFFFFIARLLKIVIYAQRLQISHFFLRLHSSASDSTKVHLIELITVFTLMRFLYLASRTATTKSWLTFHLTCNTVSVSIAFFLFFQPS